MARKGVECQECYLVLSKRLKNDGVKVCTDCRRKKKEYSSNEMVILKLKDKYIIEEGQEVDEEEYESGFLPADLPLEESNEKYLQSIPKKWKVIEVEVGFGSVIKKFVDTINDKKYNSRIDAIRVMAKTGKERRDDLKILVSGMTMDGWMTSDRLPHGWFAKLVSKTSKRVKFFTDSYQLITGVKNVMKLMNNSNTYSLGDQENILTFVKDHRAFNRSFSDDKEDAGWSESGDGFLPEGWRYKTSKVRNGEVNKIMSPEGEILANRGKAIAFLVKEGKDPELISQMRESLVCDGWVESVYLPPDWRYRKYKSGRNEHYFLSSEGELFVSQVALTEHLRASDKYTENDIKNLEPLWELLKARWVNDTEQNWLLDDESVPKGWKIRHFDGVKANGKPRQRCYIASPDGSIFQSRGKALQWMIETVQPENQVSYMRDQLYNEGWEKHPRLPQGWVVKHNYEGKGSRYLTSEGQMLNLKNVLAFMAEMSDKYTDDDLEGVNSVAKNLTDTAQKMKIEWNTCISIPDGWKIRETRMKGSPPQEHLVAPDGSQLTGRISALKYLLCKGKQLDSPDVERLKTGLTKTDWEEDQQILPQGWLKRRVRKTGNVVFLSPEFRNFPNLSQVYRFMRANNYPIDQLKKVKKHLDLKHVIGDKKRNYNYDWKKSKDLPLGWNLAYKTSKYDPPKIRYLSPTGIVLVNSALAFQLMVQDTVEDNVLSFMYSKLKTESWEEDPNLPDGWRINTDKKKFPDNIIEEEEEIPEVMLVSNTGQFLAPGPALELIRDEYSKSDHQKFMKLMLGLENRGWRSNKSLPDGWKIKKGQDSLNTSKHLISSDQTKYNSIISAFLDMAKQSRNEEMKVLQGMLGVEGWEENEKLPHQWMIVRNRGDSIFELISRDGVLLQTLDSAQQFMEDRPLEYSNKDRLGVEELCMGEVEAYLANTVATNPSFRKHVKKYSESRVRIPSTPQDKKSKNVKQT